MKKIKNPKLRYLGVMLKPDQLDILRGMKATGISMGHVVRLALDAWIAQGDPTVENDEIECNGLWGQ